MPEPGAANSRNVTIDFFRGLALLIIFVNHVPGNELLLYTPSRFGLSDAAEIFVFLSGYVAAAAYGGTFARSGFALGTVRVFHRCIQIYAAHLALFGLLALVCVLGNELLDTRDYIDHLNIRYFFDHTEEALLNLISLRYVPNYFDILPMYLVVMSWIPAVWALSSIRPGAALGFSLAIYLAMWCADLALPADPQSSRPWFFNPFGWQFLFFVGFAFGMQWLRSPRYRPSLTLLCVGYVIVSLPLAPEPGLRPTPELQQLYTSLLPWIEKTRFGPLRLLHFLALAYLVGAIWSARPQWLNGVAVRAIAQLGRLSLPMFLFCMVLSYLGGMVFDVMGHGLGSIAGVNLVGVLLLLVAAHGMAWIRSSPWKLPIQQPAAGARSEPWTRWATNVSRVSVTGLAGVVLSATLLVFPLSLLRARSVAREEPLATDAALMDLVGPWASDYEPVPQPQVGADLDLGNATAGP